MDGIVVLDSLLLPNLETIRLQRRGGECIGSTLALIQFVMTDVTLEARVKIWPRSVGFAVPSNNLDPGLSTLVADCWRYLFAIPYMGAKLSRWKPRPMNW